MLLLEEDERDALWRSLIEALEAHMEGLPAHRVTQPMDPAQDRKSVV